MIYLYATAALILLSALGYITMAVDKRRAIKGGRRISEAALFAVAFAGGGIGSLIGMYAVRHKTKHLSFVICMPAAAVWSATIVYGAAYLISYAH